MFVHQPSWSSLERRKYHVNKEIDTPQSTQIIPCRIRSCDQRATSAGIKDIRKKTSLPKLWKQQNTPSIYRVCNLHCTGRDLWFWHMSQADRYCSYWAWENTQRWGTNAEKLQFWHHTHMAPKRWREFALLPLNSGVETLSPEAYLKQSASSWRMNMSFSTTILASMGRKPIHSHVEIEQLSETIHEEKNLCA